MGTFNTKFPVAPSVFRSRTYAGFRRFARNRNAIPVASGLLLTWKRIDTHVRGFGTMPKSAGIRPVSGRDLLNILSGYRNGDLSLFNV
jgi:hypothetical protein